MTSLPTRAELWLGGAVVALSLARLAALTLSQAELYVDEAQYAIWGRTLEWGYFSKPPLTAWLSAAATAVCGTGEACVRAPSVLLWAVTAVAAWAAGAMLYGQRIGVWAGWAALLAPGAAFSARILSTDAPMLACWTVALMMLVGLKRSQGPARWAWALGLGAVLGLGVLAKYAMLYFVGCALLAAMADRQTARAVWVPRGLLALAVAAAIAAPNLLWNLHNGLATVRHTVDNAAGDGWTFTPLAGLEFVAAQALLAGPAVFAGLILALVGRGRRGEDRLLLAFSVPVFAVVTIKALAGGANANWAAAGLAATFILGAAMLTQRGRTGWLIGGLVFGAMVQAFLWGADLTATRWAVNGRSPFEAVLGWRALAAQVEARAQGVEWIVIERRADLAALIWYGVAPDRVRAWPPDGAPRDHFQMTRPLTTPTGAVLAVSDCADAERYRAAFNQVTALGEVSIATGAGRPRTRSLHRLEAPTGRPIRPAPCPSS